MNVSLILPILIFGVGFYLLVRLRFFFMLHPIKTVRNIASSLKSADSRRALSLALAGTLGVGNIFGVAAGIIIGGAGSVFWLLLSAVFAMVIKYAETLLSFDNLSEGSSGMHMAMLSVFPKYGKAVSLIYAALCLSLAFVMGASMQSAAVIGVAENTLHMNPVLAGIALAALVAFSVVGGAKKIEKTTALFIPLTTFIYIIMSFLAIFLNISRLPMAISMIFSSAFSPLAAGGGILAFFSSAALKEGFARGILSNEAGCGTSSLAHTRAKERTPHEAGLFGMCEVFFDTVVLCMLTATVILVSVDNPSAYSAPMALVSAAFSASLGEWSELVLLFCVFSFAYSTVICWYYYGSECTRYLFGGRGRVLFLMLFVAFIVFGSRLESGVLLYLTDTVILFMSALTLFVLVKKSGRIKELSQIGKLR